MSKLKKIASIALCTALLAGCVSGCGTDNASNDKVTEITVWTTNSHSKDVYNKLINEFNEKQGKEQGIKVEYSVKEGSSYRQSMELALQNDNAPDMFGNIGNVPRQVELGYIASFDRIEGGQEYAEKFKDLMMEEVHTVDGKIYSLPGDATVQGLIYNKEMFKAAGIVDEKGEAKPPKTYDEMREDAKKLTNAEKNQYGVIFPVKWTAWVESDIINPLMSSVGHTGYNPVTGEYDYSGTVPMMKSILGMRDDGSVFPGADGIDNDSARAHFSNGNIGMKISYSWDVAVLNDQFPANFDWGVAELPTISDKKYAQRMSVNPKLFMNAKTVEKKGKAMLEVYKYLTSDYVVGELYLNAVEIPSDKNAIKDVDESKITKKGWKEFCDMLDISKGYYRIPKTDMTGKQGIYDLFVQKCWAGKSSPEDVVKEYEANLNEGRKQYYTTNTDKNQDDCMNKDWDASRAEK